MRAIEKLLPKANALLKDPSNELIDIISRKIKNGAYDGYINGFGPAIITAGLIPTLATYEADDDNRKKVLDVIAKIANIDNKDEGSSLLAHVLNHHHDNEKLWQWKEEIINASIALKLMIRTFDLS